MPRRREQPKGKYVDKKQVAEMEAPKEPPSIVTVARLVPVVVNYFDTSMVKKAQERVDWKFYRIEIRDNVPYIVREMCDRCGKVKLPPHKRKLRRYRDKEVGDIYLDAGICNDCINASVYVDKYLDGDILTEQEAKKLFDQYGVAYEKAWRIVLAQAPRVAITDQEWKHACKFFAGCAMCGGPIEVQAKFFPRRFNGEHTAWNVIPLCEECMSKHYRGRLDVTKDAVRYKVFSSHNQFQKFKTIRMYLLAQMERHNLYLDPLTQWRKRFFETQILPGAWFEEDKK